MHDYMLIDIAGRNLPLLFSNISENVHYKEAMEKFRSNPERYLIYKWIGEEKEREFLLGDNDGSIANS